MIYLKDIPTFRKKKLEALIQKLIFGYSAPTCGDRLDYSLRSVLLAGHDYTSIYLGKAFFTNMNLLFCSLHKSMRKKKKNGCNAINSRTI